MSKRSLPSIAIANVAIHKYLTIISDNCTLRTLLLPSRLLNRSSSRHYRPISSSLVVSVDRDTSRFYG